MGFWDGDFATPARPPPARPLGSASPSRAGSLSARLCCELWLALRPEGLRLRPARSRRDQTVSGRRLRRALAALLALRRLRLCQRPFFPRPSWSRGRRAPRVASPADVRTLFTLRPESARLGVSAHKKGGIFAGLSRSAPGRIRTCDLGIRSPSLSSAELRGRVHGADLRLRNNADSVGAAECRPRPEGTRAAGGRCLAQQPTRHD